MPGASRPALSALRAAVPGVAFALLLAALARFLADTAGAWISEGGKSPVSPVLLAVLLGMLWRNLVGVPARLDAGLQWVMQVLLRVGIALVGLRLTLLGMAEIASAALPVVMACIIVAIAMGLLLARTLGATARLGALLAVGTAVCGCTAIVALSPVIRARHEETGFALACVVLFGCIGMLCYPWIGQHFFAQAPAYAGIFLGTAIHDTSQVIGAGLMYAQHFGAPDALAAASVTKLLRNLSIAVLIPAAGWWAHREVLALRSTTQPGSPLAVDAPKVVPLFVVGFLLLVGLRTAGDAVFQSHGAAHWQQVIGAGQFASELFLICGMTAVGLSVTVEHLRRIGWRPLVLGFAVAALVAATSLCAILALMP